MKHVLAIFASLMLMTGCSIIESSDQQDFADEINRLVPPGTDYNVAMERLKKDGFACTGATPSVAGECQKTNDMAVYNCVKKVKIYTNAANTNIVQAQISRPDCSAF